MGSRFSDAFQSLLNAASPNLADSDANMVRRLEMLTEIIDSMIDLEFPRLAEIFTMREIRQMATLSWNGVPEIRSMLDKNRFRQLFEDQFVYEAARPGELFNAGTFENLTPIQLLALNLLVEEAKEEMGDNKPISRKWKT